MSHSKTIRVLVAEDDFIVSKEITRALKKIGYKQIGMASDGEEAIEMTQKLRPDIILMDIKMPKLDGLRAAAKIQESCPTPVVVLTAHESQAMVKKASKMGVSSFLTKPPKVNEIERAVIIALARHKDFMELRRVNKKLKKAMDEIKTLKGFIPICAWCKKIRNDEGYWEQLDIYIRKHSEAEFSHSICPKCKKKISSNLKDKKNE